MDATFASAVASVTGRSRIGAALRSALVSLIIDSPRFFDLLARRYRSPRAAASGAGEKIGGTDQQHLRITLHSQRKFDLLAGCDFVVGAASPIQDAEAGAIAKKRRISATRSQEMSVLL
jgi:hypothetical protein